MKGSSDHNDRADIGNGRASSEPIKKSLPKTNTQGGVEPVSTFELSDTSSTEAHSVSTTGAQAKDALSVEGLEFEFEKTSDDHKRLEDECFRLEHEYDNAVARMTNLEEELKMAKKQAASANQKCLVHAGDMLNLTEQHRLLEEQYSSSLERTALLEKELDAAKQETDAALRKQKQRDKHLWQVIKQYKDLAEKNDSTEAKIASVQEELAFSKQHTNRRDLVHEYRMMEHEYEDAKAKIDTLERDLKSAKAEVIRSKEDAKCTRKRLAGCHFHYKKLQESYEEALAKLSDGDRELMASRKAFLAMKA
jgi:chromosome segregation ATPase